MELVICCHQYMKFEDLWEFKKHLTEKHGYSDPEADRRILKMIEQKQWRAA